MLLEAHTTMQIRMHKCSRDLVEEWEHVQDVNMRMQCQMRARVLTYNVMHGCWLSYEKAVMGGSWLG